LSQGPAPHGRADRPMAAAAEHKYRVLKRLEAGGMAEVYLGEAVSVQGFKKRVAIKRVLPHLAQNENFIAMFLDEARLSAKLNHANIVSVFDISKREDTYFLIMEFVDGVNLKKIMESLTKRGQRMRLAEAVYLCIEACRGLNYAHDLTDESGKPLGIVHRDISPPNIMVTRRGEVKLADFGLAKASTQLQTTDPGVVKGKFSYLCPEAANGQDVDARADIFALGIVLWEMLAGKRLFWGENDYATVKLIQKANVPRLAPLNREVDEAFEEVLLKALTRDPSRRYQSAQEFGDALSDYLFRNQLMVTSYDLANMVQQVTTEESHTTADEFSLIDRLIQEELDDAQAIDGDRESGSLPKQTYGSASSALAGDESFEDPASWFSDDKDLLADPQPKPRAAPPAMPAAKSQSGAWREAGIPNETRKPTSARAPFPDDEAITNEITIEADSLPPVAPKAPAPPKAPTAPKAPAPPAPQLAVEAAPVAPAKAKSGGSAKYVIFALIAAAAAVVAWFGTRAG
jgi:eukaryotic-like serine/threonine-protein kinase